MRTARIAVLAQSSALERSWAYGINVFTLYIGEMLDQAGISFDWLDEVNHVLVQGYDLVIAAAVIEDEAALAVLRKYMERGGIVIVYGGLNRLAKPLGYRTARSTGPGYAVLPHVDAEGAQPLPLRFLQSAPWVPATGSASGASHSAADGCSWGQLYRDSPSGALMGAALLRLPVGDGFLERWSIDIPSVIVGLQQGTGPVFEDGPPAPDGSAPLDDGVLKAEDMLQLDWSWDRRATETGAVYFAYPYADLWREAVIHHVVQRMADIGKPLPFVDCWPEGIDAVAMISHDSDRNMDDDALTTLQVLEEAGIRSTWCMMQPGYSPYLYELIRGEGHELALHFNANANEGGRWDERDFRLQLAWLKEATGETNIVSNKNHFTRFEGWGELFRWCEESGIGSDQTRGPSKTGCVGFPFGTCLPYFPIAWSNERNRMYDVLEIGFLTQDIPAMTDASVIAPFLEQVGRVRGVAHFLFHQGRIHSVESIRDSLGIVVSEASDRGIPFWTGREIHDWQRRRRAWKVTGLHPDGGAMMKCALPPDDAVVWRPLLKGETIDAKQTVQTRYGIKCIKIAIHSS